MSKQNPSVVDWLLEENEPSVRYLTLTSLLGHPTDSLDAKNAKAKIAKSDRVMALFDGQQADGGFGCHPYEKWIGAHWRLPYLAELALPQSDKRASKAIENVLAWLTGDHHKKHIRLLNGLTRRCASQEGNALIACCHFGLAGDPRVTYLVDSLIAWQWPDGGWNCDKTKEAHHSSFHESVIPMRGLVAYHLATGHKQSLVAAKKTGEFMLRHRLFRSESTGAIIEPKWLCLHYPMYWHYDILQGLSSILELGKIKDPRTAAALDIIEQKRLPDGRWKTDGYYWKSINSKGPYRSPVDWWRGQPNKMLTLNALLVLKASGRLKKENL